MKNEITHLSLRLVTETHEAIRQEAFTSRKSINQLINEVLAEYVKKKAIA